MKLTDDEIDLQMRRADATRVARHLGHHDHAREIEEGKWDHGEAMSRLGPYFRGVTLVGPVVSA